MSGRIVFPGAVPPSALISATDQAGGRSSGMIAGEGNAGAVSFAATGSFASSITPYAILTAGGNLKTAEFQASLDGGTTLLGRRADTTWDGNGAAERVLLDDTGFVYCSKPVAVVSGGDGILDRVLVAIGRASTTPDQIDIYYTTDFSGAGAWTLLTANAANVGAHVYKPVLILKENILYLFTEGSDSTVNVWKSTDFGTTWSTPVVVATGTANSGNEGIDVIVLASGKFLVAYCVTVSSYTRVYCKSSSNGTSWSAAKQVTATGTVDYLNPSLVQEADGKTICIISNGSTVTIMARQTTAADPATGTWAAYSETLWSGAEGTYHSTCIAPDGTIYSVVEYGSNLSMSKFKDGDANYSALATIYDPAGAEAVTFPRIAVIGGAIWCACWNSTDDSIVLILTKYVTTYNVSTAPAIWTGPGAQFIGSGLWLTPSGSGGEAGDAFATTTTFDYGADRMLALRPTHPTRSVTHGSAWNAVYDLGANVLVPIDSILAFGNIDHFHLQMNATNVWTSPSVDTVVSFARETIADAGNTAAAGKITRAAGTWVPGTRAGQRARLGTLAAGLVHLIRDNDAGNLYVDEDLSGESGDLVIYSRRAWAVQTLATYRYIRILIDAQLTAEGYYELPVVLLGSGIVLADDVCRAPDGDLYPYEDSYTRGGNIMRSCPGEMHREYQLNIVGPPLALWQELRARFAALGAKPVALIPNTADPYEWALCYPADKIRWNDPTRVTITLEESV